MIILQNNSGSPKNYGNKRFSIGEIYTIPERDLFKFRLDDDLIQDVVNNLVAVGDSVQFFSSPSLKIAHLLGSLQGRVSSLTGRQEIAVYEPEGSFFSLPGFNLADRTTWYVDSLQVLNEVPALESGSTYNLSNDFIIDATHGKITYENNYSVDVDALLSTGQINKSQTIREKHGIKVRVNSTEVVEGVDYSVDYRTGKIIFTIAPSGPVSVDYWYATSSAFYIQAPAGKIVRAGKTEVNLTKNIIMNPILQEFQIFFPPLSQFITVEYVQYDNPYNVIDINNQGKGIIPQLNGMDDEMLVFPFDYTRSIDIKGSEGTRLKISILNDEEFQTTGGPGRATATFYSAIEDEI